MLFLIVSGCKGALTTEHRCSTLINDGWQVNVIATPTAAQWMDPDTIETITGWPVRSELRTPHEPTFEPRANAVLATPVSLNTLTKWADGHADTLAIGLLCEATGAQIPTVAEIQLSAAFANHPATSSAITRLQTTAVTVRTADGGAPIPGTDQSAVPSSKLLQTATTPKTSTAQIRSKTLDPET